MKNFVNEKWDVLGAVMQLGLVLCAPVVFAALSYISA